MNGCEVMSEWESSKSGITVDAFEGISAVFTDVEVLRRSDTNVLVKAKRYGRWWLLKGLNPDVAGLSAYRQMLQKEFDLLMRAQHPSIVTAVGLEEVDGLGVCIVMEYVEGKTLRDRIQEKMDKQTAKRVVDELLDAVAYIHALGIMHRDLKPSNILLTRNGNNVKLIDFGLADTDAYAVLKQRAGTERYMSPESVDGAVADARNDLYSLGVIMQQMPLPWMYRRVGSKCLQPIDRRWQNVEEMRAAISRAKRLSRWVGNGLAAAVVVALLAGGGFYMYEKSEREALKTRQTEQRVAQETRRMGLQMDSMQQILDEKKLDMDALQGSVQLLNDSLSQMASIRLSTTSRIHVERAIEAGKAKLKKLATDSRVEQMLDTLSHRESPLMDELRGRVIEVNKQVYGYFDGIAVAYTDDELEEIRNALLPCLKEWNDRVGRKFKKVP